MTQWNQNATSALLATAAQPPQVSVPHLAMVHGAVYDAVNAIDGGREGYLLSPRPVKSVGSAASTTRTADQTLAARYWAENPPGTWSRIFRTLSAQEELSLVENARLFAMLYLTAADAMISVWDDKAERLCWRPITAIREADTDGNPRTEPDAGWLPLIATPPYPEHPSGHTGLSGSFVKTLQRFFGTDRIGWTDTNNAGLTRSFTRFSDAIDEIVDARVWSGIHFRTADEEGARIGQQVARWRERHYFRHAR